MNHHIIFKLFFFCFLSFIGFCSYGQIGYEKKMFDEINSFRTSPKEYYLKHKSLFQHIQGVDNLFEKIPPSPKIIWSDSLFREAKAEGSSNSRNNGSFAKSFCGYAGFSTNDKNPDSLINKVIRENFTTFLSPDYTHIGIYSNEVTYFNDKYKSIHVFIGTHCDAAKKQFEFSWKKVPETLAAVDMKRINTAANEKYLAESEKEMIKEINFARCYPAIYADIIANYLVSEGKTSFDTWLAGQEIVEILKNLKPMKPLLPDSRLYQCAKNHGLDEKKRGYMGHTGSDNSSPFDRIRKVLGSSYLDGSENLVGDSSPRDAVIALLIDGGIASRGHRENVIKLNWTHVGCYFVGTVDDMPGCYVQNFAEIKE